MFRKFTLILAAAAMLTGCVAGENEKTTALPYVRENGSETAAQSDTSGDSSVKDGNTVSPEQGLLWIDPAVPEGLKKGLKLPEEVTVTADRQAAGLALTTGRGRPETTWIYALAAPFPTITDEVSLEELRDAWEGKGEGTFDGAPLLLSEDTLLAFSSLWGAPAAASVKVLSKESLLDTAWKTSPSWALIPFEEVSPRWKILRVDGNSPMEKEFDAGNYPLVVKFSISGAESLADRIQMQLTNRDPGKLTVLVMTGVTALVRATGVKMETYGMDYPARDIGDWLRDADLTHISNEVSFYPECPPAKMRSENLMFCSRPEYFQLLKDVGADIIEQTGNHLMDWRRTALLESLDMYHEAGMVTYAAGKDLESARQAVVVEHNGNRLAFIGCNPAGPESVWATDTLPGAAPCDYEWMKGEINRLRQEGILPIVTLQYFESYHYTPTPGELADFLPLADAGAVIVSGSQAHYPQGMKFEGETFIHFGLGNLFFDQMYLPVPGTAEDAEMPGTRKEFIDRHVFYDGQYIGTELLTAMLEDFAKPRPMTAKERRELLKSAFEFSPW